MAKRMASYFPQGAKLRVRDMTMFGGVETDSTIYCDVGQPIAASGNLVVNAQDVTAGATITNFNAAFAASEPQMTRWGRVLSLVLSAAGAVVVSIRGRDYLGQLMREDITTNGTTAVIGKKAFRYIDSITVPAVAGTISVGVANIFGLPYKLFAVDHESKNQHPSANVGTFVAGLQNGVASTATTADVRGTYAPTTVLPDGVNSFFLRYFADHTNGHGNAQFA